ncbi:hypothetical protein CDIK_4099 [Cucumispora dikerogammari]|nr:hypothetical protein CDIK_4099 [Cucumispora dikerogammari]
MLALATILSFVTCQQQEKPGLKIINDEPNITVDEETTIKIERDEEGQILEPPQYEKMKVFSVGWYIALNEFSLKKDGINSLYLVKYNKRRFDYTHSPSEEEKQWCYEESSIIFPHNIESKVNFKKQLIPTNGDEMETDNQLFYVSLETLYRPEQPNAGPAIKKFREALGISSVDQIRNHAFQLHITIECQKQTETQTRVLFATSKIFIFDYNESTGELDTKVIDEETEFIKEKKN